MFWERAENWRVTDGLYLHLKPTQLSLRPVQYCKGYAGAEDENQAPTGTDDGTVLGKAEGKEALNKGCLPFSQMVERQNT